MIHRLWPRSFAARLRLAMVLAAVVATVLASVVLLPVQYTRGRGQTIKSLVAKSKVIAFNTTAALRFDDADAAQETLSALRVVPEVTTASLYTPDGQEFAVYERANSGDAPPSPRDLPEGTLGKWFVYREIVADEGGMLGTLVVVYDLARLQRRLWQDMGVIAAASGLGILIAVVLSVFLERALSGPLAELRRTARQVAEGRGYSARARVMAEDELGDVTKTFNHMLDQIEDQDAALSRANAELRNRHQEMEQFVYTVSHDLKSPAVTIAGFVGLLKQDVADGNTEGVLEAADHLERAGRKMSQLIDDLLSLSRIGRVPNEYAWLDVDDVVRDTLLDLETRLREAGADLVVESPLPRAWADPVRLGQVFDNLISNAVKYGCPTPGCRIVVGGRAEPGEVRYFVRDAGPGIPPQYHDRIFALFQRLENRAEGTGVGLAIVARIAETHGGRAWVDSRPGEGATFWFSLAVPAS